MLKGRCTLSRHAEVRVPGQFMQVHWSGPDDFQALPFGEAHLWYPHRLCYLEQDDFQALLFGYGSVWPMPIG